MRATRAAACLLAIATLLVACKDAPEGPCTATGLVSLGEALPDCTFEGLEGQDELSLRTLRGKPAVLNFWASWCTFCIKEMPDFQTVFASLGGRVQFVGINVLELQGETKAAAETFRTRTGVQYRMIYDPRGRLYAHFQPRVTNPIMPITIFVDRDLLVAERHFGPLTEEELRARIAKHFGVS